LHKIFGSPILNGTNIAHTSEALMQFDVIDSRRYKDGVTSIMV